MPVVLVKYGVMSPFIVAIVVTQSLLAAAVTAGFIIGAASLWLVHRDVAAMQVKIDHQCERIDAVEGLLHRIEGRRSGGA